MRTNQKQKAAAILANRIARLTKPIDATEINDALGTDIDYTDGTVEKVAEEVTTLIQQIVGTLDEVNGSDRFPQPEIKAEI